LPQPTAFSKGHRADLVTAVVAVVLKAVPRVRSDYPQAFPAVWSSRVLPDRHNVVKTTPSLCYTSSRGNASCLQASELPVQR